MVNTLCFAEFAQSSISHLSVHKTDVEKVSTFVITGLLLPGGKEQISRFTSILISGSAFSMPVILRAGEQIQFRCEMTLYVENTNTVTLLRREFPYPPVRLQNSTLSHSQVD